MARIIYTNGEEKEIVPKDGKYFTLTELQVIVEGYIETVEINNTDIMIINEDGKINHLPYNKIATQIFQKKYPDNEDHIVGNAIICDKSQVQ
jgi:hypothetical protein